MNKVDLITRVAKDLAATTNRQVVEAIINKTFEVISERMYQEEEVKIMDFASFTPLKKAARTGHNPKTGEKVDIPAKNSIRFKMSKRLKEYIQD